jgi:hypothetical protein
MCQIGLCSLDVLLLSNIPNPYFRGDVHVIVHVTSASISKGITYSCGMIRLNSRSMTTIRLAPVLQNLQLLH